VSIRGRVVAIDGTTLQLSRAGGIETTVLAPGAPLPATGDLVEVDPEARTCRVLTPWRGPAGGLPTWTRALSDPRRVHGVRTRAAVERGIRAFFDAQGFVETRTPIRVPCPGLEPHIKPFALTAGGFLHTSPEFAMKRLLVGGLERIYQLATVFRDEPHAPTHLAGVCMLEGYRAYADEHAIMEDTDLRAACAAAGVEAAPDDGWDELYFRLWLERIEPRLPEDRPMIVTRYPASQAALAVVDADPDGTRWARRFEVYVGGVELANAFYELTDPALQRRRFDDDLALRARVHGDTFPDVPIDEGFLAALAEGMPPSAGIALGVDRLVMLLADERDIAFTTWMTYDL
jgi:lysyl-tRNA synthetase class 2